MASELAGAVISRELSAAELAARLQEWFAAHADPGWRARIIDAPLSEWIDFNRQKLAELNTARLAVPHWPTERGGLGLSILQQRTFHEQAVAADYPFPRLFRIGLGQVAATIMVHGTAEQQPLLQGMLAGDVWCLGFSEPGAGSDLGSVRTRAVADGAEFVITGQKIWSSLAPFANKCLLLARTGTQDSRARGLTAFVVDLDTPGIEVRPIRQATGAFGFAEIFFDDVRIPAGAMLGRENDGWATIGTTLQTERAWQGLLEYAEGRHAIASYLRERAGHHDGEELAEVGRHLSELEAFGALVRRVVSKVVDHGTMGAEGSMLNIMYGETMQRFTAFAVRSQGLDAHTAALTANDTGRMSGRWFIDYLRSWHDTIGGGTNEIQRTIIAERILGLPRG